MELANVQPRGAWLHVNDVAGFIGPEVFKTREQLVRCCLEDIAMGKLHGLTIGLDICSTLHMAVSLGRPGLVPGPDHAGQPGLPDRIAHKKRSDAGLSYDLVPGPRQAAERNSVSK